MTDKRTKCAPTLTGVQQVAGARARQAAQLDRQVQVETGPTEHYYGTPDVAKTPIPTEVTKHRGFGSVYRNNTTVL